MYIKSGKGRKYKFTSEAASHEVEFSIDFLQLALIEIIISEFRYTAQGIVRNIFLGEIEIW
jgi:hypothetical protein